MKRTPLKRKTPMKRGGCLRRPGDLKYVGPGRQKPRKGLRAVSDRRRRELKEYAERRRSFLSLTENQWCPVAAGFGKKQRTTDVHHKAGREGKMLNDERYWLAVSRAGHDWIHAHPGMARKAGWLV